MTGIEFACKDYNPHDYSLNVFSKLNSGKINMIDTNSLLH